MELTQLENWNSINTAIMFWSVTHWHNLTLSAGPFALLYPQNAHFHLEKVLRLNSMVRYLALRVHADGITGIFQCLFSTYIPTIMSIKIRMDNLCYWSRLIL